MNVIFGAAGFAKEVLFLIQRKIAAGHDIKNIDYFVVADNDKLVGTSIKNIPVISENAFFTEFSQQSVDCFIAVGSPILKNKILKKIEQQSPLAAFPPLIDPSVIYDMTKEAVKIGTGAILCANTVLTTDIAIKPFVHINLDCTVGHDSVIGSFTTISPGVHISGNVTIGESVFIGTGAVILENLTIADNIVVGAGAVVTSSLTEAGVYVGIPAKKRG